MTHVTIDLSDEDAALLARLAAQAGKTPETLAREAVLEALEGSLDAEHLARTLSQAPDDPAPAAEAPGITAEDLALLLSEIE